MGTAHGVDASAGTERSLGDGALSVHTIASVEEDSVYHRAKRRRTLMAQESRISIKALLVGAAVDLVGSSLFGAVVGFCWAVVKAG